MGQIRMTAPFASGATSRSSTRTGHIQGYRLRFRAVTYIARGKELDGKPPLRYITLLREGARAHGLRETYIRFFLEGVEHAQ
jgi:hypothetical protein